MDFTDLKVSEYLAGLPESEQLFHMIIECLETTGRELEALEWMRRYVELETGRTVTVLTAP